MIDRDIVARTLSNALRRGGEFAEVFVEDRRAMGAGLDDGRVEELSSGRDRGAGIRVVSGETTGFAHTADLSESGLAAAAEAAAAVARGRSGGTPAAAMGGGGSLGGKEGSSGPTASAVMSSSRVEIFPEDVPKGRKVDLLSIADEAARSGSSSISQVSVGYGDSRRRILVANSEGLWAEDDQVRTRFAVSCVATRDGGMQTGFEVLAKTVGFELLDGAAVEEVAREAARRAITKLDARPAPTGPMPVVIQGGSGGILFHEACGHGLEADHILKGSSVYAGRVGERVAGELVTLVDDGTMSGEWGAFMIDDEGCPARRNTLIEAGVLSDYMWDYLRASKENRVSSGNGRRQSYQHLPMVRMTNTYILAGNDDPGDIIAGTHHGVYVAKLGGGQVNTTTGDFVFGMVEAYLIEDGKITEPLRDANLIGNGPDVLSKVDAVGNDFATTPGTCGKDGQSVPVGCGQPTLRVAEVTIGGTAGG